LLSGHAVSSAAKNIHHCALDIFYFYTFIYSPIIKENTYRASYSPPDNHVFRQFVPARHNITIIYVSEIVFWDTASKAATTL